MIARHQLIEGAIGTFPEEDEAYWRVTTLMWALPLTVTLAALFDFLCVIVYMKYGHPWKGILSNDEETERNQNEDNHEESRSSKASADEVSKIDDSSEPVDHPEQDIIE